MDKRFPPTPKRLRDARRRGDVAHSADVSGTLLFVVVVALVWLFAGTVFGLLRSLWLHASSPAAFIDGDGQWHQVLQHAYAVLLAVCVPLCVVAALAAAAGSLVQVGGLAAWTRLKPQAARLNPAAGLKRLASLRSLIDLGKMVLKTVLLGALLVAVIRTELPAAARVGHLGAAGQLAVFGQALMATLGWAAVVLAALAVLDVAHQRFEFTRRHRMSFEELRRELDETEGSPLVHQRRKAEHHEAVFATLADRLAGATLTVHSHTVAAALQYEREGRPPRVLAIGQGDAARRIRALAAERRIYDEFNPVLAEQLLAEAAIDQAAPAGLHASLARVLARGLGQV